MSRLEPVSKDGGLDTSSHQQFVDYYAKESLSESTRRRFEAIQTRVLALAGPTTRPLNVLDIGCGAGAQCALWAASGHHVFGIDINAPLIEVARKRAQESGIAARFDVGSATDLPFETASMDVCLIPELLEHVPEWQPCLAEAVRVLRPGGILFLSTTNFLCPVQNEYRLPLYSWYPGFAKRYFEKRAVTSWPAIANYARYPAVHWFSYYQLARFLTAKGMRCHDRFAVMDAGTGSGIRRAIVGLLRHSSLLRLLGQICSTGSVVFAVKSGSPGPAQGASA